MSKTTSLKLSRPLLDRIMRIQQQLHDNKYPNCNSMAEKLGVSPKTVQRDFEYMRDRMELPLDYDRGKHGYYFTEPVADLPAVQISEGEVVGLLVAQKALEQYRGTPFEHTLETAFKKITSRLRDVITFNPSEVMAGFSFRSFGASKADIKTFGSLARAVRLSREVTITYQKPAAKKPETRRVRPYHLANIQNLWYVISFDTAKNDLRKFALPRIKSVRLEETKFQRPANFSIDSYLNRSFGAFSGTESVEVRIRFDAFAAGFIRERTWHETERLKAVRGGGVELTMHVPRLEEVQSWVLSWGAHARVISPVSFATSVRDAGKAIADLYA
jgi:proteasome accessory factor B